MIATTALLSPAPGAGLLAIAGGIGNPAVPVEGPETAGAGSGSADTVSFSALLAGLPNAQTATPQPSELAANPVAASPAAPSGTRPIAQFFAVMARSVPEGAIAATGRTPPPTGKVLPQPGIASAVVPAIAFPAVASSANDSTADAAPADDSTPADPASTDVPAPAIAPVAIASPLILPQPPAPATDDPKPTAVAIVRLPAKTLGSGREAAAEPAAETARRVLPASAAKQTAGDPAPIGATEMVRNALAAPLTRLAANASPLPVAATMQVALPMSAAPVEGSGERPPALFQQTPRGRTVTVTTAAAAAAAADSDPADRLDAAPRELAQAAPTLAPAPLVAPFMHAVAVAFGNPSEATAAASVSPAGRVDFATLVDTIARAREHASPQAMTAPVSVSLAHADFGPVALRFRHEGDALAVTMASADPGFASAVSAAAAADASANAGQGQPGNGQQQSSSSFGSSTSQGSAQTGSGQAGQGQAGQNQADQRQPDPRQPGGNRPLPRTASQAANRDGPDPDIFA